MSFVHLVVLDFDVAAVVKGSQFVDSVKLSDFKGKKSAICASIPRSPSGELPVNFITSEKTIRSPIEAIFILCPGLIRRSWYKGTAPYRR